MRIAIVRLSALGDIIVSAVFLPYFKERFPDVKIDWYIDTRFSEILKECPYIDNLCEYPFKKIFKSFQFFSLYQKLQKNNKYDLVIDMQGLIKTAIIAKMLRTENLIGFDKKSIKEKLASFFYKKHIHIGYEENILKRNKKILYESFKENIDLNLALKDRKRAFCCTKNAKQKIESLEIFGNKKTILFVLEASLEAKTYPIDGYIELANLFSQLPVTILLLVHNNSFKAQAIFKGVKDNSNIIILPKLNFDEIKALFVNLDLVIGGDTGITHLAWAMQIPSVTLYGNTPIDRFRLFGEKNISLSQNTKANYSKNDFSIQKITPLNIYNEGSKLL